MAERPQYVTLGVAEELFAAPVEKVQEILDMRPIARLPQAPGTLLGMIDVRGQGIPVVDLRLTLGLPPARSTWWPSRASIPPSSCRNRACVSAMPPRPLPMPSSAV